MNCNFKAVKQWNAYKCLCGQWWTRSSWVTRTNGIDQRATTCPEWVNEKEHGNKFGKTFVLKVYVYGITLICQKSGSKDSSAWLYWSLCRKSHSNNLRSSSCAALASPQINRCAPVWLETGCLQKALNAAGAEGQLLHGWGGCQMWSPSKWNPLSLPHLLCLCSPLAVYTCLVQTCPQGKLGRLRPSAWKEEEKVMAAEARGTGTWGTLFSFF